MTLVVLLQVALVAGLQIPTRDCTEDEVRALISGARMVATGDDTSVQVAVQKKVSLPEDRCPPIKLARSSLMGWTEARALASKGGPVELLGPTQQVLKELEELRSGDLALEAEYAQSAIRAAVAAAQDERPEMELLLAHARDLSERLAARGRHAIWPRGFNVLAGELWLEVDRYEDARRAFDRAVRAEPSAIALVGLGRALLKLNRSEEACATFRRVRIASGTLRDKVRTYLASCP